MESVNDNYHFLIKKLDEFVRKFYLNKVLRGGIYLLSSFFALFLIISLAEYWGNFNQVVRGILFYGFLTLNLIIFIYYILIPLFSYFRLGNIINYEKASLIIGNHFYPIKDKLLNTLQLKKLADNNTEHNQLMIASINQRIIELTPIPFTSAINLNENKKYLKFAIIPLCLIVSVLFLAPSILDDSTNRIIHFNKHFEKKAPFDFVIVTKNLTAVSGDDFKLEIKLIGNEIPQEVYLEDGVNTFKLDKESIVRFNYVFKNLQKDKIIHFSAGEYSSPSYTIDVKRRPEITNFDVKLNYPSYLGKKNETISNNGDFIIPEGTRLTWILKTENADKVEFISSGKKSAFNSEKKGVYKFEKRALGNFEYNLKPANSEIRVNDELSYNVQVIPDLFPAIQLVEKPDSVNNKVLYFVGQLNDDYGFSKLIFDAKVIDPENGKVLKHLVQSIPFNKNGLQSSFFHAQDFKTLVSSGQSVEYFFEIWDNDAVNGAKSKKSEIKIFKSPTTDEVEKQIDANTESVKNKMSQAIRKAAEVEKEAKRLNQALVEKKTLNYDDKKQIEELLSKQKELESLIKDIQKDNKQNLFEQKENQNLNEELLQKQKQIEDLFNNVLDEKTREILKNIEKLLEENNKNSTQDELSKMQVDQKSLQKELDRILELYKQLEFDQKLALTTDKLKELSKEQQELSEATEQKKQSTDQLKKDQESLNTDFSDIKKNLDELQDKNQLLEKPNDFQNPEKEQQAIEEQQKQSSENLEKKNNNKASQNQKNAAEKMQQLAQKLESMQQESEMEESEVNIQSLREILDNLLITSFDQEKVMQTFKNMNPANPNFSMNVQKQKDIKDHLKMVEDSLYSLSKKVPQIETVVNKEIQTINNSVKVSLENLSDRKIPEANRNQQFAMTSINNLALMLSEALDQLQKAQRNAQSGGKGKKKQSLSQLSKMQEQLNKNMQQARQKMQQEGGQGKQSQGKGSMSQSLAKMAREQQIIRQAMQDINREMNKDGQNGLGNLDKLMKQMEQTETDLVNRNIQQETIVRQQEILTKLLEAEKADREREQDVKRESKKGIDMAPDYKIFLQEYQKIKQRETELLKTVPPALNSFYKIKVGDYFKFLNSGNNEH